MRPKGRLNNQRNYHKFICSMTKVYTNVWLVMSILLRPLYEIGIIFGSIPKGKRNAYFDFLSVGLGGDPCHAFSQRHSLFKAFKKIIEV